MPALPNLFSLPPWPFFNRLFFTPAVAGVLPVSLVYMVSRTGENLGTPDVPMVWVSTPCQFFDTIIAQTPVRRAGNAAVDALIRQRAEDWQSVPLPELQPFNRVVFVRTRCFFFNELQNIPSPYEDTELVKDGEHMGIPEHPKQLHEKELLDTTAFDLLCLNQSNHSFVVHDP